MQRQALEGRLHQQWRRQVHSVQVGLRYQRGEVTVRWGLKQVGDVARLLPDEVSQKVKEMQMASLSAFPGQFLAK